MKRSANGLRLLVSPEIRDIDKTLAANKAPVVIGVPSYILPHGPQRQTLPQHQRPQELPASKPIPPDAITADPPTPPTNRLAGSTTPSHGKTWGRVLLTLSYDDGTKQSVHYYVIKPAAEAVSDLGNFMFTKMWFGDAKDPFGRAPSIMTYDRANNKIVSQDTRVWVAGLGDEGGSSWVAGAMKEFGQPKKEEVAKYEAVHRQSPLGWSPTQRRPQ